MRCGVLSSLVVGLKALTFPRRFYYPPPTGPNMIIGHPECVCGVVHIRGGGNCANVSNSHKTVSGAIHSQTIHLFEKYARSLTLFHSFWRCIKIDRERGWKKNVVSREEKIHAR